MTHKGGGSTINCIKRFQNAHALSVSLGNSYSEDQLMHTFLNNFHQGGKYSAQISRDYPKIGGDDIIEDYAKRPSGIFCMQTLMYTAED